jgi:hypothetical protein
VSDDRWRRVCLNAFLAWNLVAVVAWVVPGDPSAFRNRILAVAQPYLAATGLWQYWDMFAPKPFSLVAAVEARITFADGTRKTWVLPGPEDVRFGKYFRERWRKWRNAVRVDANRAIWPEAARLAARRHANPANPPVRVDLVRSWTEIPPPTAEDFQPRELLKPTRSSLYFTYEVAPEDLGP